MVFSQSDIKLVTRMVVTQSVLDLEHQIDHFWIDSSMSHNIKSSNMHLYQYFFITFLRIVQSMTFFCQSDIWWGHKTGHNSLNFGPRASNGPFWNRKLNFASQKINLYTLSSIFLIPFLRIVQNMTFFSQSDMWWGNKKSHN